MDDFIRIRATERALEQYHFASLGEAQEHLSSPDFDKLMQEINVLAEMHAASHGQTQRKPSRWRRWRSRT